MFDMEADVFAKGKSGSSHFQMLIILTAALNFHFSHSLCCVVKQISQYDNVTKDKGNKLFALTISCCPFFAGLFERLPKCQAFLTACKILGSVYMC